MSTEKRISRGNIIILVGGGLHRQCADYRFEPAARQVIKSQEIRLHLFTDSVCTSVSLSSRGQGGAGEESAMRFSGRKTPLTKVNSHDQSLFAGARSTDKYFIRELLPRIATSKLHDEFAA